MTAEEFRNWRVGLGLSQARAAEELGVSTVTVFNYERGFRTDTSHPVVIPKHVELACEAISRKLRTSEHNALNPVEVSDDQRLCWDEVTPPQIKRAREKLRRRGVVLNEQPAFFQFDRFMEFAPEVMTWLWEYGAMGFTLHRVVDLRTPGGSLIVLDFHDSKTFTLFKFRWWGSLPEKQ